MDGTLPQERLNSPSTERLAPSPGLEQKPMNLDEILSQDRTDRAKEALQQIVDQDAARLDAEVAALQMAALTEGDSEAQVVNAEVNQATQEALQQKEAAKQEAQTGLAAVAGEAANDVSLEPEVVQKEVTQEVAVSEQGDVAEVLQGGGVQTKEMQVTVEEAPLQIPTAERAKKLEASLHARLQQMDQLVFQLMNSQGLDESAKIGLREKLEELQQENSSEGMELGLSPMPRNEALFDAQANMVQALNVLDQMLAEHDPSQAQEHVARLAELRSKYAADRATVQEHQSPENIPSEAQLSPEQKAEQRVSKEALDAAPFQKPVFESPKELQPTAKEAMEVISEFIPEFETFGRLAEAQSKAAKEFNNSPKDPTLRLNLLNPLLQLARQETDVYEKAMMAQQMALEKISALQPQSPADRQQLSKIQTRLAHEVANSQLYFQHLQESLRANEQLVPLLKIDAEIQTLEKELEQATHPMQKRRIQEDLDSSLGRRQELVGKRGEALASADSLGEQYTKTLENQGKVEKGQEGRNEKLIGLMDQAEALMQAFQKNGLKAGSEEVAIMRKLMREAHPDKNPGDVGMEKFFQFLGRLKMAFEGDVNSWKNPRGVDLQTDFAAFRKDLGIDPGVTVQEQEAAQEAVKKDRTEARAKPIEQPQQRESPGYNEKVNENKEAEVRMGALVDIFSPQIREIEQRYDEMLEEGDQEKIDAATDMLKALYRQRMGDFTKDINAFYKLSPDARTARMKKGNEIMEYEEELLGTQMDIHREKKELAELKRQKSAVDTQIEDLQAKLEAQKVADSTPLLNAAPSGAMVLAADAAAPAMSYETQAALRVDVAELESLVSKQKELGQEIGLRQASLDSLYVNMNRIIALRDKAVKELASVTDEKASEGKEKKLKLIKGFEGEGEVYAGLGAGAAASEYDAAAGAEGKKPYKEGWFEKIGDVVAEAMHGDQSSIYGASKLITEIKESILRPQETSFGGGGKSQKFTPKVIEGGAVSSGGQKGAEKSKKKEGENAEKEMSLVEIMKSLHETLQKKAPGGYSEKDLVKYIQKEAKDRRLEQPGEEDVLESLRRMEESSLITKKDKMWYVKSAAAGSVNSYDTKKAA